MIIICDGLPFIIGKRVIERTYICSQCKTIINGQSECEAHTNNDDQHKTNSNLQYTLEFGWVLLQPGPGHIEMNMLKSYVNLNWHVYWEQMVEVFNFKSEAAKKSGIKVNDHHKGWTLARIARESLAKELLAPYVREQIAQQVPKLSCEGYLKWVMTNVKDPNYAYMRVRHFRLYIFISCWYKIRGNWHDGCWKSSVCQSMAIKRTHHIQGIRVVRSCTMGNAAYSSPRVVTKNCVIQHVWHNIHGWRCWL